MNSNVFAGAQMVLKSGDPIENLRLGKSKELSLSSSTGEFNAHNTKELALMIGQLMQAVNSGQVVPERQSALASSADRAREISARRDVLAAAFVDKDKWEALGASLAMRIDEARTRQGFLRNIAVGQTLRTGEVARVSLPSWDAVAVVASSSAMIGYQLIRSKIFEAPEFEIIANLRCEALDLEQISGDLLDDLYEQGLDAIMVAEDRLWKMAADKAVGITNPLEYIAGQLNPGNLARLSQSISDWNVPATTAIVANDFWADVISNPDFHEFLDPVTKYDLALHGNLGTLVGLNLMTDAFRQPNQKVLNRGEIYVVGSPENHAAYTDRGGVRSTPTSGADQGNTTKGWLLSEMFSFVLANPRSVAKGQRV
jgi:hypothetical protein